MLFKKYIEMLPEVSERFYEVGISNIDHFLFLETDRNIPKSNNFLLAVEGTDTRLWRTPRTMFIPLARNSCTIT